MLPVRRSHPEPIAVHECLLLGFGQPEKPGHTLTDGDPLEAPGPAERRTLVALGWSSSRQTSPPWHKEP